MSGDGVESVDEWRKKCADLEKVIKTLSTHCVKVVEKHEDLLGKYKKNQEQYNILVGKLKEKGEQIKKAKDVLQPVTLEYQALKEKYEIALQCQYEAENYASKVNHKNEVLKRQSQMLLQQSGMNVVEINFEDEDPEENSAETEYHKKLNQQITELEEQKVSLKAQVENLNESYHYEKEKNSQLKDWIEAYKVELTQAKDTIGKQEKTLEMLAKTSEAACQEYEELHKHFEKEITGRTTVEKLAHGLYAEREAARRQSAMLMKDIGNDKKLMEALMEIEDLTTKMEKLKAESKQKIEELEQQILQEKERTGVESLETENAALMQERDSLLQKLADTEKTTEQLHSQYSSLTQKYEDLEKKLQQTLHAPPPPPPPPPPPLPVAKTGGFLAKITGGGTKKKREKRLELGGAQVSKDYSKAVDEMMKRIKQGSIGLKPVLKKRTSLLRTSPLENVDETDSPRKMSAPCLQSCPDDDEDGTAMKELKGILNKMKKARSEDDLSAFDEGPSLDENCELAKTFNKIQQKRIDKGDKPRPTPRKLSTIKDEPE